MKALACAIAALLGAGNLIAVDETLNVTCPGALPVEVAKRHQGAWRKVFGKGPTGLDLTVRLRRRGETLDRFAWCRVPGLAGHQFLLRIDDPPVFAQRMSLTGRMAVQTVRYLRLGRAGENAVIGGGLELRLNLQAAGDGWQGTFTSTATARDAAGIAADTAAFGLTEFPGRSGSLAPPGLDHSAVARLAARSVTGSVMVDVRPAPTTLAHHDPPMGHPRLLFTSKDLPRVRQWAASPLGKPLVAWLEEQVALAAFEGFHFHNGGEAFMQPLYAAAEGFLYHLDGEEERLQRAASWTWTGMHNALADGNQWRQSWRILGVALAYDLCAPAWDDALRADVYNYLIERALEFSHREDIEDPLAVGDRYSYQAQTRPIASSDRDDGYTRYAAASLLGLLAILGDEPPITQPPSAEAVPFVAAARDYVPALGVPVVGLESGFMFERWLCNGPFALDVEDPYAALGGFAAQRPAPGDRVDSLGIAVDWRPFHPTGVGNKVEGPHLYPRVDMRYFTNSTGNGYPPGKQVAAKLKARHEADRSKPEQLVVSWYTVWDNRDEEFILARPNWGWVSRGVRMWVNGHEVADGDILRVEPGLYPVLVHVPVIGGYNNQGPHLIGLSREHLAEMKDTSEAVAARFRPGAGPEHDLTAWLVGALASQIRIYLEEAIDPGGWGATDCIEHLGPLLHAWKQVLGEDPVAGTGLERAAELAIQNHPYHQGNANNLLVAHLLSFLEGDQRAVGRWFLERYGFGQRRPVHLLAPLASIDPSWAGRSPEGLWPRARRYDAQGMFTFGSSDERQPTEDFLVLVDQGSDPMRGAYRAQQIELRAASVREANQEGRHGRNYWWVFGGGSLKSSVEVKSGPIVQGMVPMAECRVLDHQAWGEDGSGTVSLRTPRWERWHRTKNGSLYVKHQARAKAAVNRAVAVDYSGTSGAPMLMIIADRFEGFKNREMKAQQFFVWGNFNRSIHGDGDGGMRLLPGDKVFTLRDPAFVDNQRALRHRKVHHYLRAKYFSRKAMEFRVSTIDKLATQAVLTCSIDRVADESEAAVDPTKTGNDLLDDETALDREIEGFVSGDVSVGGVNEWEDNVDDLIAVITVAEGRHPEVDGHWEGGRLVIDVGGRRVTFDGERIRLAD